MIDDPEKTAGLISDLASAMPFEARLAPALVRALSKESPGQTVPPKGRIVSVGYLGDEGGVVCGLELGTAEREYQVSITHLEFDRRSPLFRRIAAYQRHRIKKLKQQAWRALRL